MLLYLHPGFDDRRWDWVIGLCLGLGLTVKYTIAGALLYGALSVPTRGGVWLYTVAGNAAQPDIVKAIRYGVIEFLPRGFSVLVLGTVGWVALRPAVLRTRIGAVAASVLCAIALFVAATSGPGSSASYFLEPAILGSLLLALAAADPDAERPGARELWRELLATLLLVQLPSQAALLAQSYGNHQQVRAETLDILRGLDVAGDEFVLGDAYYTRLILESGHRPLVYDNHVFSLMHDNGVVPAEPLLQPIRDGRVPYVVLEYPLGWHESRSYGERCFPPAVLDHLASDYTGDQLLEQWDGAPFILCRRTGGTCRAGALRVGTPG